MVLPHRLSQVLNGLDDPLPEHLTDVPVGRKLHFPADCWQGVSASCHVDFSTGLLVCLHGIAIGFPQSKRTKKESKQETAMLLVTFLDLVSEVTNHHV